MFMTKEEFNETLDLLSGKAQPSALLDELRIWARDALQAEVFNYFCDYATSGRVWLRLVLWDYKTHRVFYGPNCDKRKQKAVAEKFSELARLHQVHREYWDSRDISVGYETLCDEIQKDIIYRVADEIKGIQHPDIWKIDIHFESIHIFYETDEQIVRNEENGTSDDIKRRCTELVKPYDVHNAFPDGANCVFTSHQTLDEKYAGNMYFYFL